jgi:hypothetical protein
MKIKAVVDRFEGNEAILIVGENKEEHIVLRASLPRGVVEGLWLLVEIEDHRVMNAVIDEEEVTKVKERLARFKRERNSGDSSNGEAKP